MPWLPELHSLEEDIAFLGTFLAPGKTLVGVVAQGVVAGMMATSPGWIEQLYVHPEHQAKGIGSRLLQHARSGEGALMLWAFQRNGRARRFYERHGFVAVEFTDGGANEEREPDVRCAWSLPG